jgi:hypothetical protein
MKMIYGIMTILHRNYKLPIGLTRFGITIYFVLFFVFFLRKFSDLKSKLVLKAFSLDMFLSDFLSWVRLQGFWTPP